MALHSPFDLKNIFIVDLAGSAEIFTFLAVLLVSFAMSKFSLPNKIALPMFVVFAAIMSIYLQGLYVLVIILVGISVFYSLSKVVR